MEDISAYSAFDEKNGDIEVGFISTNKRTGNVTHWHRQSFITRNNLCKMLCLPNGQLNNMNQQSHSSSLRFVWNYVSGLGIELVIIFSSMWGRRMWFGVSTRNAHLANSTGKCLFVTYWVEARYNLQCLQININSCKKSCVV